MTAIFEAVNQMKTVFSIDRLKFTFSSNPYQLSIDGYKYPIFSGSDYKIENCPGFLLTKKLW
jgi:hypothetical protein